MNEHLKFWILITCGIGGAVCGWLVALGDDPISRAGWAGLGIILASKIPDILAIAPASLKRAVTGEQKKLDKSEIQ